MTPAEVTAEWVDSLRVANGRVVGLTVEPVGAGVGLLTTVVRAVVTWEPVGSGPSSVIVKLPSADPGNRAIVGWFGYDRRELGAYRELEVGNGSRAPRLLAVEGDALVLEDLGGHRLADQLAGASAADALAVAAGLAEIHARWWADEGLGALEWLPGPTDPKVAGYGTLLDRSWGPFLDHAGTWVTTAQRSAAERAMRQFDGAIATFATGPLTLVHGDPRLDNWLFDAHGEAVAVDWQLAARGNGAYDVAFFAAGSLETGTRRSLGAQLLDHYRRALQARGVSVGSDELEAWYRLGHVQNLANPVTALVAVNPGGERGRRLLEANARRALDALVELGL